MVDLARINELAERLAAALPPGAQQLQQEVEAQFRKILGKAFAGLDLVNREEFLAQTAALERATIKLQALEQRLQALEQN